MTGARKGGGGGGEKSDACAMPGALAWRELTIRLFLVLLAMS